MCVQVFVFLWPRPAFPRCSRAEQKQILLMFCCARICCRPRTSCNCFFATSSFMLCSVNVLDNPCEPFDGRVTRFIVTILLWRAEQKTPRNHNWIAASNKTGSGLTQSERWTLTCDQQIHFCPPSRFLSHPTPSKPYCPSLLLHFFRTPRLRAAAAG